MKASQFHRVSGVLMIAVLLLSFAGCSTRRNTAVTRFYHKLTSHYNVYWNGEQSYREGIDFIKKNTKDNYNHILPVYNYGNKALVQQVAAKMDRAIKKASLTIQEHSMVFNGKEEIPWVGKSYLLMGRAHFIKKNYEAARRVFDFVAKQYDHQPFQYEAMLWLSKTYIASGAFEKAQAQLNLLRSQKEEINFPLSVKKRMPLVEANLYIAMQDYGTAYQFLEKGLKTCSQRDMCSRLMFILGQINQNEGHFKLASDYYKKVIKKNPAFQMAFEARLRMATSYDSTQRDLKFVQKTLEHMARNHVYKAYLGQIYFAMAQVAERNQNDSLMVYHLRRSVAASTAAKDDTQRAVSSLKLARVLFAKGDYPLSQAYYDTALMSTPQTSPDYATLEKTTSVLKQLTGYLITIRQQDSLQQLSRMDTSELNARIDNQIIAYQKDQETKANQPQNDIPPVSLDSPQTSGTSASGSGWYFYNARAKAQGYNAFVQRWGQRKPEDLWFLSSASGGSGQLMANAPNNQTQPDNQQQQTPSVNQGVQQTTNQSPNDPTHRAYYLKNIPRTRAQLLHSDSLMMNAYDKAGYLYLESLHDTTRALHTYLEYLNRFPENKKKLQLWYTLYSLYSAMKETEKAGVYKNYIINNYPNSLYAKVVQNPDYYQTLLARRKKAQELYGRAYQAFRREQYYRVIDYAERARHSLGDDSLIMPKFLYLKAIAQGKVQVPDSLYTSLQALIKAYPHSNLVPRSQAIIKMLQLEYGIGITPAERAALLAKEKKTAAPAPFTFNPNSAQEIILVVNKHQVRVDALQVRLADFNQKFFRSVKLRVIGQEFNQNNSVVLVQQFKDVSSAKAYYQELLKNSYVFSGMQRKDYHLFIISLKNYPLFYRDKNIASYQDFFKSKY